MTELGHQAAEQVLVQRIVVGDQHFERPRRDPFDLRWGRRYHLVNPHLDHYVVQLARRHGLGERCLHQPAVGGSRFLRRRLGADKHDRKLLRTSERPQRSRQREAVDRWEAVLDQRDVEGLALLGSGEGFFRCGLGRDRSPRLRLQRHHATLGGVRCHHEHIHGFERHRCGGHLGRHRLGQHGELEKGARVRTRLDAALLHPQFAVHHLDQPPARREVEDSQPVAGLQLRRSGASLTHPASQDSRRHALAGVPHAELESCELPLWLAAELDPDSATVRPFQPAAQQREQDLLDPPRIPHDHARDVELGAEGKVEALGSGDLGDQPKAALDTGTDVERVQRELELAALDHGCVEDLLDEPRHLLRAQLDDRGKLSFLSG